MKVTSTAGLLAETISTAALICPSRPELPAYGGVLLETSGQTLTVRGCDGPTTVAARCEVDDAVAGSVLVPPKPILKYLTSLAPDTPVVAHAASPTSVEVSAAGAAPYKFTALAAAFPTFAALRRDIEDADLAQLGAAVSLVADCAGSLSTGKDQVVQLVSNPDGLRLHATDRYRLARAELGPGSGFGTFDGLLPLRVLELVATVNPSRVQVDPKGRQLVFHGHNVVISTRLAQDPFPTVESVLGAVPPYTAQLDRVATRRALKRLTAVASPGCLLRITIEADSVTLAVNNAATGSGSETLPLGAVATGEVSFAVNFDYLASALDTYTDKTVTLGWSSPLAPVFLTSTVPLPTALVISPMADD